MLLSAFSHLTGPARPEEIDIISHLSMKLEVHRMIYDPVMSSYALLVAGNEGSFPLAIDKQPQGGYYMVDIIRADDEKKKISRCRLFAVAIHVCSIRSWLLELSLRIAGGDFEPSTNPEVTSSFVSV